MDNKTINMNDDEVEIDLLQLFRALKKRILWIVGAGVIMGVTESALLPQGSATRAQVATMLMRFCEYYADTK